jgi:CHAT domain-containing protein
MSFMRITGICIALFCVFGLCAQSDVKKTIQEGKQLNEKGLYAESEAVLKEGIERQKQDNKIETVDYSTLINELANVYYKQSRIIEADSLYRQALLIRKEKCGEKSLEYAETLNDWAELKVGMAQFEDLENWLETSLEIRKKKLGEESVEYALSLTILSHYYTFSGQIAKAGEPAEKAVRILAGAVGEQHPDYALALFKWGDYFLLTGQLSEAEKCYRQATEINGQFFGESHPEHLTGWLYITTLYGRMGKYREAVDILLRVIPLLEESLGKKHGSYIGALSNLGAMYAVLDENRKASNYLKASLELSREFLGEKHSYYFNALNALATVYLSMGLYEKAEPLYLQSLQLRKELQGEENASVVAALNNLGNFYGTMGNFDEAEKYSVEAIEIVKKIDANNLANHIAAYGNLVLHYCQSGKTEAAIQLFEEIQDLYRSSHLENTFNYILMFNQVLSVLSSRPEADYTAMEQSFMENMQRLKSLLGETYADHIHSAICLNTLAQFYDRNGQYEKTQDIYLQILAALRQHSDEKQRLYSIFLANFAANQWKLGKHENALQAYQEAFEIIKDEMKQNFVFLSEKEQELFRQARSAFLTRFHSFSYQYLQEKGNTSVSGFAYENELFFKSLLLNSSRNIRQSILESGNEELIQTWTNLQKNARSSRGQMQEEKEIIRQTQIYRTQQKDFSIQWRDVQNTLGEKEAAIEFIHFENRYCALLLRPDYPYPQMTELCSDEQLLEAIRQSPFDAKAVYPLIWKPLEKQLKGVNEIYLAPSGALNSISFAGMKKGKAYLGDHYTIHHLISTKDIAEVKSRNKEAFQSKQIALFGGADFGLSAGELVAVNESRDTESALNLTRSMLDNMDSTRGQGFDYLPGSKQEVQIIAEQLFGFGWNTSLFVDKEATETRFKSLSSAHSPEILHVSTHGFYFPQAEKTTSDRLSLEDDSKQNPYKLSDNPLMRSGLVFTGANHVWSGKELAGDIDDGILTAYEVSDMNLSHTRLVVLSACETGLGDVIGSEGIYGLQRAFRLAGAQLLLVSLWKVPDKETIELMTAFYSQWMQENNIQKAFSTAQRQLRKKYPDEPEKWAGFVLIE